MSRFEWRLLGNEEVEMIANVKSIGHPPLSALMLTGKTWKSSSSIFHLLPCERRPGLAYECRSLSLWKTVALSLSLV